MDAVAEALKQHFGFDDFRPGQREVIERLIDRLDTLAVLPTGIGKSLCYQLPAMLLEGITLVISPLIALMQDQMDSLGRRGFKNATLLNSALTGPELAARYRGMERGQYKLVYVAPERSDSARFRELIRRSKVSLLVIDEAHCISQWGHDFRPHYRNLLGRLPELAGATVLALTATATPEVQNDIVSTVGRPEMGRVIADFDRPTLHFSVVRAASKTDKDRKLAELLSKMNGPVIVYASTRKEADCAHDLVTSMGISACLYHGGLDSGQRALSHRLFQENARRVIVATVAFGMGIDKPDISSVIHYDVPGSLETYYQEAGRAGRNGQPAECTLLYLASDLRRQEFLIDSAYPERQLFARIVQVIRQASPLAVSAADLGRATDSAEMTARSACQFLYDQQILGMADDGKYYLVDPSRGSRAIDLKPLEKRRQAARRRLGRMVDYCERQECRRKQILGYFGQVFNAPCGGCDVCDREAAAEARSGQATIESDSIARTILSAAREVDGRFGRLQLADSLIGRRSRRVLESGLDRASFFGTFVEKNRRIVVDCIDSLIDQAYLFTRGVYPCVYLSDRGLKALGSEADLIWLPGNVRPHARGDGQMNDAVSSSPILQEAENKRQRGLSASQTANVPNRKAGRSNPFEAQKYYNTRLKIETWRQGGPAVDPDELLRMLNDSEGAAPGDRVVSVGVLAELGCAAAIGPIRGLLASGENTNIIAASLKALGRLGAEPGEEIIRFLSHPSPLVRAAAAQSLGRLRCSSALGILERLAAEDPMASVRLAAKAAALLITRRLSPS